MPSLRLTPRTAALLVAACTFVAYLNSLGGRFVMDDRSEIADNPAIRSLLPPWRSMLGGRTMPARPLPYLSFAVDHAVWGQAPFGYHVTNLGVHTCAALALFAFARLALSSPRLRDTCGGQATPLAACIATIWAVHPLCTQAVTYVYQRIESMTGMFCLVALAAFAQAAASGWKTRWLAASVLATAAAMGSKETAVVLPLVILGYDRLVLGSTLADLRRRRWFYASLVATCGIIGVHVAAQRELFQEFQGGSHPPLAYALTQPRVILHYLRLAFWPVGQCFDMPWRLSDTWREIVPSLVYLTVMMAVIVAGMVRRRPWSWLGLAFLLALAPTSSIMPVAAPAAEHRMYLPLAAVVAAAVLGVRAVVCRTLPEGPARSGGLTAAAAGAAVVVAILILLTQARNELYATPGGIWMDVLRQQPQNGRALWNLAIDCEQIGEFDTALRYADEVADLFAEAPVYEDLAEVRLQSGDNATAERILRHGIARRAESAGADAKATVLGSCNLAVMLDLQGRPGDAEQVAAAVFPLVLARLPANDPRGLAARLIHARGLDRGGDAARAEQVARDALADASSGPDSDAHHAAAACLTLGRILHAAGRQGEAEQLVRRGLSILERTPAARQGGLGDAVMLAEWRRRFSREDYEELLRAIRAAGGRRPEAASAGREPPAAAPPP